MINQHADELFPIVDTQGRVVGSAYRAECHSGSMLLHPVVHLHLFNSLGELYLQHRPAWKDIQPNRWDTGVGGHVDYGEEVAEALIRESREELGIEGFTPQFVCSYIFESDREREMVNVFTTYFDGEVCPTEELDGGRFWSAAEIFDSLGKGIFTPNFESELRDVLIARGLITQPVVFRHATSDDLPEVMNIVAQGQAILRSRGVDQWQDGYPTLEVIARDIELEQGYILEQEGSIAAYGALIGGEEPAYTQISGGAWLSDLDYLTIHRLMVSSLFRGVGIGEQFFKMMESTARSRNISSLRADTHADNMVMRRLLTRLGFSLCGDVYFRGSHRFAFERVI